MSEIGVFDRCPSRDSRVAEGQGSRRGAAAGVPCVGLHRTGRSGARKEESGRGGELRLVPYRSWGAEGLLACSDPAPARFLMLCLGPYPAVELLRISTME